MSWAARRRFLILFSIIATGVAVLAVFAISVIYKTPTCTDGIKNQGESEVDCGGPCPYLCTDMQQAPVVLFTKILPKGNGRTDVVASIENMNAAAAAKQVPYTVTVYGSDQTVVQQASGTVDLAPAATVPVYIAGMSTGDQTNLHAFLTIASSSPHWFTMTTDTRVKPVVSNTALKGTTASPRIDATVSNPGDTPMADVPLVVLVHDAQNEIITASRTLIPLIPAQGQSTATFTWNEPFSNTPAAIEVIPIVSLP